MKKKILLSFSGGKDSVLALYYLKKDKNFEVVELFTTVNRYYKRVSIQGIREEVLRRQVRLLNLPVKIVYLPKKVDNKEYEKIMFDSLKPYLEKKIKCIAFGDIFLEEIRKYRENNLSKVGMECIFPLWKKDTEKLAQEFISLGFKAKIISVNYVYKDLLEFLGEEFNGEFLDRIKDRVCPCGENGEFHTLVYAGPIFKEPLKFKLGKKILKDNNYYVDVLLS